MKLSEHEIFKYVTQHILDPQLWAIALDLQILIDHQENKVALLEAKLTAIECGDCGLTMLECACDEVE